MRRVLSSLVCLWLISASLWAEERPIHALLVTGGCCHDYERQKAILTKGISARANVVWTVVHQGGSTTDTKIPLYEDPAWAEGFDVIVHNECFAHVTDPAWLERILDPHRAGTPAVLIHCAMHCYRTGSDDWFEFVGQQSPGHGPHYSYDVLNVRPEHPIMQGFGEQWTAPQGELYHTAKLWPTATPLGQAKRQSDGEPQTCIWTNQYGNTRVFGTTIGHYNSTMAQPEYLDMVTRGLLWAVDRLDDTSFRKTTPETDAEILALVDKAAETTGSVQCCGMGNLALGAPVLAKSEQSGNFARQAVDGDLRTRYCANGAQVNEWWQVDLGKPEEVKSVRIHWEKENIAYRYLIEGSADGEQWQTLVDASQNSQKQQVTGHDVSGNGVRHLKVTFLGAESGMWGSFWEFEAYAGELPPLPEKSLVTATVADVTAPPGFNVSLYGVPPTVNYPVCLTASIDGEVFVGVDEQGSLGKEPGKGKVLRCRDIDGDGQADQVNTFAVMDHPRGLVYDNGSLWVLHPPFLTVFHDDDRDGTADREERLITGISTDEVNKRGADHTTNGIRMGIDGWIYIAVGDFGFVKAEAADGTVLSRRGGGIVRIRPDGSNMEIYAWGQRNILDVCIDPYLNIFTRDNTNDGGGWDIRLSHVPQSANMGYPSLYMDFSDEIMPPLADYGGGSGCGGFYLHDLRWPEGFNNTLYTCDWGRSEVYLHNLPAHGASFEAHQDVFLKIPRPTDIDTDGSGRMYVSSWKDGKFAYDGPNVGFVALVTPQNYVAKPAPEFAKLADEELVHQLRANNMKYRLHAQREILRRSASNVMVEQLQQLAADHQAAVPGRVASIFTLKQLLGSQSHPVLLSLVKDEHVREFALRALTDRVDQLTGLSAAPFVEALQDPNPRVQAAAVVSLGRLGDASSADAILPLTLHSADALTEVHNLPDPERTVSHLAVQALIRLQAEQACLQALDGPYRRGAQQALGWMHTEAVVSGIISQLEQAQQAQLRTELLTLLIRLYHRQGEYTGGWWGTRPDRSGPFYDRKSWEQTPRIEAQLIAAVDKADDDVRDQLAAELRRHRVLIKQLPNSMQFSKDPGEPATEIKLPTFDPDNPDQIGNLTYEMAFERTMAAKGTVRSGRKLFQAQSCSACHTYEKGQTPKGPHLVDIGKRYQRHELINSILKPSEKIAQGFDTYVFATTEGKLLTGFVVSESAEEVQVRQINGLSVTLLQKDIEDRVKQEQSMMPLGIVNNLTPEQLADLVAYLQTLK